MPQKAGESVIKVTEYPYRVPAIPSDALELLTEGPPIGLVRANGSRCKCGPPGHLWCCWYSVQVGDRWYCAHGGGWERKPDYDVLFTNHWTAMPAEKPGEGSDG